MERVTVAIHVLGSALELKHETIEGCGLRLWPASFLAGEPVYVGNDAEVLALYDWLSMRYEAEWTDDWVATRLLLDDAGKLVSALAEVKLRWPGSASASLTHGGEDDGGQDFGIGMLPG